MLVLIMVKICQNVDLNIVIKMLILAITIAFLMIIPFKLKSDPLIINMKDSLL